MLGFFLPAVDQGRAQEHLRRTSPQPNSTHRRPPGTGSPEESEVNTGPMRLTTRELAGSKSPDVAQVIGSW